MESIDIRDFTSVTALDSDNLLLSRADGTAAKVSLSALKTALGEVFAAKAILTTEATHRADADSALRADLVGVTRSVEDLVAANEQTLVSFAEVRAQIAAATTIDAVLRPLYKLGNTPVTSASATPTYNAATGLYSLNGLTDITPAQMLRIYAYSHVPFVPGACLASDIRTNLPWNVYQIQRGNSVSAEEPFSARSLFARCSKLEVAAICTANYAAKCTIYNSMFFACNQLHTVDRISLVYCTAAASVSNMFYKCAALVNVKIEDLKISGLSFADSPLLSAESVAYLIDKRSGSNAISVTVHPTTLANINQGAGDWSAIRTAAAAKNIEFTT